MKKRDLLRLLFFIVFTTILVTDLFSQEKPRIAVLPFSALEVSESEARVITSLFETALVKTEVYNVLEQNQVREILDAQAYSISGCTDDSCAVEVGELLSAELIVLGELSQVGGRYIANAKIIDVELGKNENADSVTADNIADMTDTQISLLAFKLAGLTYTGGGAEVKIVENFSEVFINTEPDGADIYINGRLRGVSPVLLEKIPQGSVNVAASKGNMYGEIQKSISGSDLVEVFVKLEVTRGRMFIKSSEPGVDVFIDGVKHGELKKDLYKDIPAGNHILMLKGNGWFWEEEILIEKEKTLTVEAYPREMGVFSYILPEGAEALVKNNSLSEIFTGTGVYDIPAGTYDIIVTMPDHDTIEEEISIGRAEVLKYAPQPVLSQAYLDSQALDKFTSEFEGIKVWKDKNPDNFRGQFNRFYKFYFKLTGSGYSFTGLEGQVKAEAMAAGRFRIDELDAKLARTGDEGWSKPQKIAFWSSAGSFVLGMSSGCLVRNLLLLPEEEYYGDPVDGANTTELALVSHNKLVFYRALRDSLFSISGAGLVGSAVIPFIGGNAFSGIWKNEREEISRKLAEIHGGMAG